jgi:hypothetical protein
MKFLANWDLAQNQLLNAVIQQLSADPSNPVKGQIYFNTQSNRMFWWNGSAWIGADSTGATMTGDNIITALNGSSMKIDDDNLSTAANSAITNSHTHSNKTTLDSYTQTEVNLADAVSKKHSHSNSTALDAVSGTNTGNETTTTVGTLISGATAKTTLVDADMFAIMDSAASNVVKKFSFANFKTAALAAAPAETATTIGTLISGATAKTTPIDADSFVMSDSAASNAGKKVTLANLKTVLGGTLTPAAHNQTASTITDFDTSVAANSTVSACNTAKHTQGTDSGTNAASFTVGSSGMKIKTSGSELQIRNNADSAYADLRCLNLFVEGTTTTVSSNDVNIGDAEITLNSDITTSATNSDGGIAVKRLMADNTTRKDAKVVFNNSTGRWQTVFGDVAGTLVTANVANKVVLNVGNGSLTTIPLTHNLNTRDAVVEIRESASPYAKIMTDVEFTDANTVTLKFAVAPTSNQYVATIIG